MATAGDPGLRGRPKRHYPITPMSSRLRSSSLLLLAIGLSVSLTAMRQTPSRPAEVSASAEAIRLNNLGVATMNQQKFDPALKYFEQAAAADPSFVTGRINEAIALISLQRYDAARELLEKATQANPQNARAWYNLGLLQKSTGEAETSLAAFQKAAALAPRDAHTAYFVGLMAGQIQQYDTSIAAFQRALELDPFLVSAEFGLARSYQRAGRADEAKGHLERFQRLTTEKVAAAMSLTYGDQGPLSLAQAVLPKGAAADAAVPVTFTRPAAQPFDVVADPPIATGEGPGAGACVFDADDDGDFDVVVLTPMTNPGRSGTAALFLRGADGTFARADSAGITLQGGPVGCVAADYDNDEKPDLAITDVYGAVTLFHNEGGGRFTNASDKAGLPPAPAVVGGTLPPGGARPVVHRFRPRWRRGPHRPPRCEGGPGRDGLRQRERPHARVPQQRQRHVHRGRAGARTGRRRRERRGTRHGLQQRPRGRSRRDWRAAACPSAQPARGRLQAGRVARRCSRRSNRWRRRARLRQGRLDGPRLHARRAARRLTVAQYRRYRPRAGRASGRRRRARMGPGGRGLRQRWMGRSGGDGHGCERRERAPARASQRTGHLQRFVRRRGRSRDRPRRRVAASRRPTSTATATATCS